MDNPELWAALLEIERLQAEVNSKAEWVRAFYRNEMAESYKEAIAKFGLRAVWEKDTKKAQKLVVEEFINGSSD